VLTLPSLCCSSDSELPKKKQQELHDFVAFLSQFMLIWVSEQAAIQINVIIISLLFDEK
jgi:hypothetical protein